MTSLDSLANLQRLGLERFTAYTYMSVCVCLQCFGGYLSKGHVHVVLHVLRSVLTCVLCNYFKLISRIIAYTTGACSVL